MKDIIIPIHSMVDIITNSSTEIYVGANNSTIDFFKELINTVLKEAGSDKKADDLFTFELKTNEDDDNEFNTDYLIMKSKNSENISINLKNKIARCFDIEACYG